MRTPHLQEMNFFIADAFCLTFYFVIWKNLSLFTFKPCWLWLLNSPVQISHLVAALTVDPVKSGSMLPGNMMADSLFVIYFCAADLTLIGSRSMFSGSWSEYISDFLNTGRVTAGGRHVKIARSRYGTVCSHHRVPDHLVCCTDNKIMQSRVHSLTQNNLSHILPS